MSRFFAIFSEIAHIWSKYGISNEPSTTLDQDPILCQHVQEENEGQKEGIEFSTFPS